MSKTNKLHFIEAMLNWFASPSCGRELDVKFLSDAYDDIAAPAWRSVEEELPEMYERVLVAGLDKRSKLKEPLLFVTCRAKEEYGIECDRNGFSVEDIPSAYKKVTHWMPLPQPPVKKGGEQ